jgi:hypothetical protein
MRKERIVNFCAGMMVGMLIVAVAVEVIVWWRQQGERYGLSKPVQVVPVVYRQDRPAIRQAEIERRHERFAEVAAPKINMDIIIEIESAGLPTAVSSKGCRGLCQIAEGTWKECTERMGVNWTWEDDAFQPSENRAVGAYYLRVRIPQMLRHYGIDDNVATRIGAYNAGIGRLRNLWHEHGSDWLDFAPKETRNYVAKYKSIMEVQSRDEADPAE